MFKPQTNKMKPIELYDQSNTHFTVGKDSSWKLKNVKKKVYDKSCKGYITALDSNSAAFMMIPKEEKKGLGLDYPFIVF